MATKKIYVPDHDGPVDFAKVESIELSDFDGVKFVRERTCENMSDDGRFMCSSCKCLIRKDGLTYSVRIGIFEHMMLYYPRYCPSCGARVVG